MNCKVMHLDIFVFYLMEMFMNKKNVALINQTVKQSGVTFFFLVLKILSGKQNPERDVTVRINCGDFIVFSVDKIMTPQLCAFLNVLPLLKDDDSS